ncbi:endolytic transglycosylase MltG [Alicyclobacillus mengziensis]|uniref:Endolytic murein transglycosylase n=1 Tax=Alicyclobacillus mengziensis TaxID=2931921 RepID=A0A9X7VWX0_9BACL|nr:endolytic transglycosylase MltG [Alicyclobacillus mengziensis]QSO46139.1 endolytic transglycosylase MltG [Alicyclobacillus mengziensis]
MSKRKWHSSLRLVITVSAVFAVAVIVIGGFWTYFQYQSPVSVETGPARVVIERGESVTEIGQQLQQAGLIKNASVFRWYIRLSHAGGSIQAGMYDIPAGARLPDIVSKFRRGDVVPNTVKVTVPEGYTVADIAARLETHHICSKQAFLTAEQQGTFTESFVSLLPRNKDIKYRFEGYLFPDTYEFVKGESAQDVINTMLQDFQHHIDAANVMTALKKQGETLPTLITEASLIEKEALAESDGPLIASVIQNRLKKKMKLQIDATIQYILGHRDIVTEKDLKVKDSYNTYLHYGLPPGPIASPGMTSIMAALHPAKTTYLYYVAKYDGSGTSYFSSTEAQHLRNVNQSEANLKRHGGP